MIEYGQLASIENVVFAEPEQQNNLLFWRFASKPGALTPEWTVQKQAFYHQREIAPDNITESKKQCVAPTSSFASKNSNLGKGPGQIMKIIFFICDLYCL